MNQNTNTEKRLRIEAIKKSLKSCVSNDHGNPLNNQPSKRTHSMQLQREMSTNSEASSSSLSSDDIIIIDTVDPPSATRCTDANTLPNDAVYSLNQPPPSINSQNMLIFKKFLSFLLHQTKNKKPEKYTRIQALLILIGYKNIEINPETFLERVNGNLESKILTLLENGVNEWKMIKGKEFVSIRMFFEMFAEPKKQEVHEDEPAAKKFKSCKESEEYKKLELQNEKLKLEYEELLEKHNKALIELEEYSNHSKRVNKSFLGSLLNASCYICFEKLSTFKQSQIKVLPCGHIICQECASKLMRMPSDRRNCPFCRHHLSSSQKFITLYPSN